MAAYGTHSYWSQCILYQITPAALPKQNDLATATEIIPPKQLDVTSTAPEN